MQQQVGLAAQPLRMLPLPRDVAGVLQFYLDGAERLEGNLTGRRTPRRGYEIARCNARPLEQLGRACRVKDGSGPRRDQYRVGFVRGDIRVPEPNHHPILRGQAVRQCALLRGHQQPPVARQRPNASRRVVLSQQKSKLGPGSKESIRFVDSTSDEIVDQDSDVCLIAFQEEWLLPANLQGRVYPRNDALPRRLLVPRGAIDLAREEETGNVPELERVSELVRREVVVFDRVSGLGHHDLLHPRNRAQKLQLHLRRKGGGEPVHIQLVRLQPLRFEKDLVPQRLGEADDLVLDRRTVARTPPRDFTPMQRTTPEVTRYDILELDPSVRDPAGKLLRNFLARVRRESIGDRIAVLTLGPVVVDGPTIDPRRSTGLEAGHLKPEAF